MLICPAYRILSNPHLCNFYPAKPTEFNLERFHFLFCGYTMLYLALCTSVRGCNVYCIRLCMLEDSSCKIYHMLNFLTNRRSFLLFFCVSLSLFSCCSSSVRIQILSSYIHLYTINFNPSLSSNPLFG